MPHLQPFLVFRAETTRLNTLYWTSKYSYTRTVGLLKLISDTGPHAANPRVDQLWGSSELGQSSIASRSLSDFIQMLDANAEALRTTSILQMCSAFENALCGYFSLCALYQPKKLDPQYTGAAIPAILQTPSIYAMRLNDIKQICDDTLHGKYTKRLKLIVDTWGMQPLTSTGVSRINSYYNKRHLIAHDQSLGGADSPDNSAEEILKTRLHLNEVTWKSMFADFFEVLTELNDKVASTVVKDSGIALAVHRIVSRDGPQITKDLSQTIQNEWRIGNVKEKTIRATATSIGLKIKQVDGNRYQVRR